MKGFSIYEVWSLMKEFNVKNTWRWCWWWRRWWRWANMKWKKRHKRGSSPTQTSQTRCTHFNLSFAKSPFFFFLMSHDKCFRCTPVCYILSEISQSTGNALRDFNSQQCWFSSLKRPYIRGAPSHQRSVWFLPTAASPFEDLTQQLCHLVCPMTPSVSDRRLCEGVGGAHVLKTAAGLTLVCESFLRKLLSLNNKKKNFLSVLFFYRFAVLLRFLLWLARQSDRVLLHA